jgi:micrococcal nuclease
LRAMTPPMSSPSDVSTMKFRSAGVVVLAAAALMCAGCSSTSTTSAPVTGTTSGAPTTPKNAAETGWRVQRVVDGDTIVVVGSAGEEKVRFAGIDTPETVKANTPVQCYGPQASQETHALLDGQKVVLESDPTQPKYDQYGRRLAHVWTVTAAGTPQLLVSWYLVRNGYAHARTYGSPTSWQSEYETAQRAAKAAGAGFWSASTCGGDTRKPA